MSDVFCANGSNQSWQVWVSLRGKTKRVESQMANSRCRMQDGRHHQVKWEWMSLSQIELVESKSEWSEHVFEWIWEKITSVWIQDGSVWIQNGRIHDGCHHQVESEWMSEVFFVQMMGTNLGNCEWVWEEKLRWLNPIWHNSRWLTSSS